MQVLIKALEESPAAKKILVAVFILVLCQLLAFWLMWSEVRRTDQNQSEIARQTIPLIQQSIEQNRVMLQWQDALKSLLQDVQIDMQTMKDLADTIQKEEVTRLSGDSEYMRQWLQMRGEQSEHFRSVDERIAEINAKVSQWIEVEHSKERASQK